MEGVERNVYQCLATGSLWGDGAAAGGRGFLCVSASAEACNTELHQHTSTLRTGEVHRRRSRNLEKPGGLCGENGFV